MDTETAPDMKTAQAMEGDNAPVSGQMPDNQGDQNSMIKLDLSNPDVADAFADCEPGETLTVKSKDDSSIVLMKGEGYSADAGGEEPAKDEPKGAVAILMAKKAKH